MHTIDEALETFSLIAGEGSEDGKQACAMTLLSWIHGDGWSGHPECAHRLLADLVIRANDDSDTTPEMRAELVRLGETGILDTWWIPTEVIVYSLATLDGEEQPASHYDRVVRALPRIAAWKDNKTPVSLRGADLAGANLRGADLAGASLACVSNFDLALNKDLALNLDKAFSVPVAP